MLFFSLPRKIATYEAWMATGRVGPPISWFRTPWDYRWHWYLYHDSFFNGHFGYCYKPCNHYIRYNTCNHYIYILDITQINIMRPSILVAASTKEFGGSQRGHQCLPSQPTMGGGNRSVGEVAWQEESSSIRWNYSYVFCLLLMEDGLSNYSYS